MDGLSGIYSLRNNVNGKIYIGSAINLQRREWQHNSDLNNKVHYNKYLQRAWNKYWSCNFQFLIIEYCEPEKLIEKEQFWLNITNCWKKEIGYNLNPTAGSSFGIKRSEEVKMKISEANKGRKHTEEHRRKNSLSLKNKPKSEEHKKNISLGRKGIIFSKDHIRNLSNSLKGKIASNRNKEKWPHANGRKCKCEECFQKRKFFKRQWDKNNKSFFLFAGNN